MKRIVLLLLVIGFTLSSMAQVNNLRRLNVGDSVQIAVDSTQSVNDEIVGIWFSVTDYTPRLVERNYVRTEDIDKVIAQLELEMRYQKELVRAGRAFLVDSLGQGESVPSAQELVSKDANVTRLKNELKVWRKIQKKIKE